LLPFEITTEVRLRDFQNRIIHRILPTKELLFRMKIAHDDVCSFCHAEVETLEHLFVNCEHSRSLWDQLETYLSHKCDTKIQLMKFDVLFGLPTENIVVNYIALRAKRHIYYRKVQNALPNMSDFKAYLLKTIQIEKYSAKMDCRIDRITDVFLGLICCHHDLMCTDAMLNV